MPRVVGTNPYLAKAFDQWCRRPGLYHFDWVLRRAEELREQARGSRKVEGPGMMGRSVEHCGRGERTKN